MYDVLIAVVVVVALKTILTNNALRTQTAKSAIFDAIK